MFRSKYLGAFVASLTFLSVFQLQPANSAVVRRAELPELIRLSHIVVHGIVSQTFTPNRKGFFTGIELEVLTPLKGVAPDTEALSIELPGGQNGNLYQTISGMPHLKPGDEVVVLLEQTTLGHYVFTGLSQGVYFILRGGTRTLAIRDLGPLLLVGPNGEHIHGEDALDKVLDLDNLIKRIQQLVEMRP